MYFWCEDCGELATTNENIDGKESIVLSLQQWLDKFVASKEQKVELMIVDRYQQ